MERFVIIVAGGSGKRFGSEVPKQFLNLNGLPVLMHTINCFYNFDTGIQIIITLPARYFEMWQTLCNRFNFTVGHQVVAGGETRFHSVLNGLDLINTNGLVAIHDGVRPMVSGSTLQRCFNTAAAKGNAIPVVAPVDSIREKLSGGSRPVDRNSFVMVQTPQVFDIGLIKAAYKLPYSVEFTDDATVAENNGVKINLVEGNRENIKITTQSDLLMAEALLKNATIV